LATSPEQIRSLQDSEWLFVREASLLAAVDLLELLDGALGVALDAAAVKALLDTLGEVVRDEVAEGLKVGTRDHAHTTEGGGDNVGLEVEEVLGDLANTGVGVGEGGDEGGGSAVGVVLLVDGTLGEDGHLEGVHGVATGSDGVLLDEVGDEAALDDNVELSTTGVDVGSVHAARLNEGDSHGDAVADEGREGAGVGGNGEATKTQSLGALNLLVGEVKDAVTGLVEQGEALGLSRGQHELADQSRVTSTGVDRDGSGDGTTQGTGVVGDDRVGVGLGLLAATEAAAGGSSGRAGEEGGSGGGGEKHLE
jgi:hypothetical protein